MEKQNLDFEVARDSNEMLYHSELSEKNVGMLDFVILGIDLALSRYCLLKLLLLACFVVSKYVVFI